MVSLGTVLEVTVDHLTPALVGGGIGIQVYGRNRKMVPLPPADPRFDLPRCLSRISETINRTSSANTTKARRALMCTTKRLLQQNRHSAAVHLCSAYSRNRRCCGPLGDSQRWHLVAFRPVEQSLRPRIDYDRGSMIIAPPTGVAR
jgi:hypothetical protein